MAKPETAAKVGTVDGASAVHDGRFGQRFDDEVKTSAVLWATFGLAVVSVLGMLITWGMMGYYAARAEAEAVRPSPYVVVEPQQPVGPLLQQDPEAELQAMRREMAARLGGYGWVDEAAGVVHMPIDKAMDLLVEQGLNGAGSSRESVEESVQ